MNPFKRIIYVDYDNREPGTYDPPVACACDALRSNSYNELHYGRLNAVLKPLVIDLKARQGNKGQVMKWFKCSENKAPQNLLILCFIDPIMETAKCFHNHQQPDDWYNSSGFRIFPDYWTYLPSQPERLNPEDAKCVCDSPNTEYK